MPYTTRVDGSEAISLAEIDPGDVRGLDRSEAEQETRKLGEEFSELEDLLYYAGRNSLLIVLQGRDTSGKDGTIRNLLAYSNVQSSRVVPFRPPTEAERAHDFLWRVHAQAPRLGELVIFNRSHYEDVLAARIHRLVPKETWERRFAHIRNFESLLADSGTILLKFFLHISREEQEERLLEREKETAKAWKLNVGDWRERELWDDYTAAAEDAINRCAATAAPWQIVAADRKWFRNLAVLEGVVLALRPYRDGWCDHLSELGRQAKLELEQHRSRP